MLPKILVEPLLRDDINKCCQEIFVYCFKGNPKIIIKLHGNFSDGITVYNKNFKQIDDLFNFNEPKINFKADKFIIQACVLSKNLANKINFVRVDWMIYQNKLYFEELTFTPYSGFRKFINKNNNLKLGVLINI